MIDTNLTSISTYGWWTGEQPGESVNDKLTPISTFGWWVDAVILGNPDILCFNINIHTLREMDMCR